MFDRNSTDEYWLTLKIELFNFSRNCLQLACMRLKYLIPVINSGHRSMSWDDKSLQSVDFIKFFFRSFGCTRHTRKLLVHSKIVLECNRSEGSRLFFNPHAFFSLNSLMQTF